jgi:hypothetical protein
VTGGPGVPVVFLVQYTLLTEDRQTWLIVNRDKTKVVVFVGAQLLKARQEGAFYIDRGAIMTVRGVIQIPWSGGALLGQVDGG